MRVVYPSYYEELASAEYPFEGGISRSNGAVTITNDIFIDGRLFPPAGRHDVFLASISIGDEIVVVLSDAAGELGSCVFQRAVPPDRLLFRSADGVYLGLLEGDPNAGIKRLLAWPDGTYTFVANQTRFAATVVVPQPHGGVRSLILPDGSVFRGRVVLYGENGVQLTMLETRQSSSSSGAPEPQIRVDVVGDPLFVRRQCEVGDTSPDSAKILKAVMFDGTPILPDINGQFHLFVGTTGADDEPALRVLPDGNGLRIGFIDRV